MRKVKALTDGSCFFDCFCKALNEINTKQLTIADIRQLAANGLVESDVEDYNNICMYEIPNYKSLQTLDEIKKDVCHENTYVNMVSMRALLRAFDHKYGLNIVDAENKLVLLPPEWYETQKLQMFLLFHNEHYDALRLVKDKSDLTQHSIIVNRALAKRIRNAFKSLHEK